MGLLTSRPWWRTPFGNVVVGASSWFLITVLLIVLGTIVYTVKAVLLTPVAVENQQRIEQRIHDNSKQAVDEYERDQAKAHNK